MKRIGYFALVLLVTLVLGACSGGGDIRSVRQDYGDHNMYTRQDIDQAMDQVLAYFQKEFDDCTLLELTYQEDTNQKEAPDWALQYETDQAMVLLSSFRVGPSGGDGSLNPNQTYENWKWVLTRSGNEAWELQTWGYG